MRQYGAIDFRSRLSAIKWALAATVIIMAVKFLAWYHSGSHAILSDALESFINLATSIFTYYSLVYASRLRDADHPYGHGKIEYLSVGVEGVLIFGTGIFIIASSIQHLVQPVALEDIDLGLALTAFSSLAMFSLSRFLIRRGKELGALPLMADGKHYRADAITSVGIIAGLFIYKLTGWVWVDPVLAIVLSLHIMFSGAGLIRESIDRLLDKADMETIEKLVTSLQKYRAESWIDIHNLRLQKFGHYLHVDGHLTLPFYLSLEEVHDQIKHLENALNRDFNHQIELFIHTDPCQKIPCRICKVGDCPFRVQAFERTLPWTTENLMRNRKHEIEESQT